MAIKVADSFIVKLAVELGLKKLAVLFPPAAFLFTGCLGDVVGHFAGKFIGFLADQGILVIDLGADAIKVAFERREYREAAIAAYKKARARVYTEEEKRAIRKQYLDAIRKYVSVGNGPKP